MRTQLKYATLRCDTKANDQLKRGGGDPQPLILSKQLVYYVNIACSITKGNGA